MKGLILLVLLTGFIQLNAQEKKDSLWKKEGVAGLKLTQVSLSNWSAGGESSVAFDAQFTYNADYKKGRNIWQNRLELGYGMSKNDNQSARKANDKIYLSSTYGYQLHKNLYWSVLATFNSQFAKGYNYSIEDSPYISRFMAPGYLVVGTGLTWTPKPWLKATFTPASWRGTFVLDDRLSDEGAFGLKEGKKLLSEFGANLVAEVNYDIMKNVKLYSRFELFSNYLEDPQNVDVKWDLQINMIVNKWLSANVSTNLVYDNDVKIAKKDGTSGPKVQFKEVLGVGLQFHF